MQLKSQNLQRTVLSTNRYLKNNFLNSIRLTVILLTIVFIVTINLSLSSNTLNKRFHSALANEEIDGTTSINLKYRKNRILRSNRMLESTYEKSVLDNPDMKKLIPMTVPKTKMTRMKKPSRASNEFKILESKLEPVKKNMITHGLRKKLNDILITIKTTKSNHIPRLKPIIETWFKLLSSKTYFITDEEDEPISRQTGEKLIVTNCEKSHARHALVCKMAAEYEIFRKNPARWYCHVDDDTYLNADRLSEVLSQYDPSESWYIGRRSTSNKINISYKNVKHSFNFATGGAGICISHGLAKRLNPYMEYNRLKQLSDDIGMPDDVVIGFISEVLLGTNLTENFFFHSHLETLHLFNSKNLFNQVSLSYEMNQKNFVDIESASNDVTKFLAIHRLLYPN